MVAEREVEEVEVDSFVSSTVLVFSISGFVGEGSSVVMILPEVVVIVVGTFDSRGEVFSGTIAPVPLLLTTVLSSGGLGDCSVFQIYTTATVRRTTAIMLPFLNQDFSLRICDIEWK